MTPTLKSGIYQISNLDGTLYVGSAVNLTKRKGNHFYCLREGNHPNIHLQRAWNRDGADAFTFSVLEYVERLEDLTVREQAHLDATKLAGTPMYNILEKAHSQLGFRHSDESKAKISRNKKGFFPTDETRQRLSVAQKARVFTEEQKKNMSEARQGIVFSEAHKNNLSLVGKKRTLQPQSIEAMRVANKGRALSPEHKAKIGEANRAARKAKKLAQESAQNV